MLDCKHGIFHKEQSLQYKAHMLYMYPTMIKQIDPYELNAVLDVLPQYQVDELLNYNL